MSTPFRLTTARTARRSRKSRGKPRVGERPVRVPLPKLGGPVAGLAALLLFIGPAAAETWRCDVPYDEVNGGGHVTVGDTRLVFVSNWPHRKPETVKCIRTGATSECMSADLVPTRTGGASVFAKLYSIVWQANDGPPVSITTRQASAIFAEADGGFALAEAFPAIAYSFPVTGCTTE